MKKISFKTITTLWIAVLITAVCALNFVTVMITSQRTADDKIKQTVIAAVEGNADEMEYSNGVFEVENDFIFFSGGIYCDIFTQSGDYIVGQTPESLLFAPEKQSESVDEKKISGEKYYVYSELMSFTKFEYEIDVLSGKIISYEADVTPVQPLTPTPYSDTKFQDGISTEQAIEIALEHARIPADKAEIIAVELNTYHDRNIFKIDFTSDTSNYEKVYIRAVCPIDDTSAVFNTVGRNALYLFPIFIVIAAIGAYIITKKTVRPIERITASAREISSGKDLSKRLDTSKAPGEIHTLGETFNGMFERLQDSFENEKRFTSDASHELRTPLAVIKAECEYALSDNADDEDKLEALVSVKEQTDKMTALVSSLLAVTRAEQQSRRITLEQGNISALLTEVCDKFITTKGITLHRNIEKDIYINMNATLITQLAENLISNADKYGRENGTIDVSLKKADNGVILCVRDNGIGISADDLPKIWNRFFRADASRSETEGFGLGLALVKNIAEIHGADCDAKSEIGKFTEISITFKNF